MSGTVFLLLRLLIALALYAFLGLAIWTLWQDLQRQSRGVGLPLVPPLRLLPKVEAGARSQRFTQPEFTIGRDLANELCVDDKTVSSRHARLSFRQGQWWVEDLRSTNGTYINSEPVTTPLVLASGDLLRCGQVTLQVTIGEDEPA
jgi:pSer/pThr/pTyr-binding forkhead associated (FHA) protein